MPALAITEDRRACHTRMRTLCKMETRSTNSVIIRAEAISFIQSSALPSCGEKAAMLLKRQSSFMSPRFYCCQIISM